MATPREVAQTYYDTLINSWGRDCLLIFPEGKVECNNCVMDVDTNRSSGIFQVGGPNSFSYGQLCPVCLGNGVTGSFTTRSLKMNIQDNPSKWNEKMPPFVDLAKQPILTWAFMTEYPHIVRARRMTIKLDILGYNNWEYTLAGEPTDPNRIVPGRYVKMFWERTGGS